MAFISTHKKKLIYDTLVRAAAVFFTAAVVMIMNKVSVFSVLLLWFALVGFSLAALAINIKAIAGERDNKFIICEIAILTDLILFLPYLTFVINNKREIIDSNFNLTLEGRIGAFLFITFVFLLIYLAFIHKDNEQNL